jgi:hypothetical protein
MLFQPDLAFHPFLPVTVVSILLGFRAEAKAALPAAPVMGRAAAPITESKNADLMDDDQFDRRRDQRRQGHPEAADEDAWKAYIGSAELISVNALRLKTRNFA